MKVLGYISILIGLYFTVLLIGIISSVRPTKEIDIDTTIETKDNTFTYTYEYKNKKYGPYQENIDKLVDGKYKIKIDADSGLPSQDNAMLFAFLITLFLPAIFFFSFGYYHLKMN